MRNDLIVLSSSEIWALRSLFPVYLADSLIQPIHLRIHRLDTDPTTDHTAGHFCSDTDIDIGCRKNHRDKADLNLKLQ